MATPVLQRIRQAMMALRTTKRFDRLAKTVLFGSIFCTSFQGFLGKFPFLGPFWRILAGVHNNFFSRVGKWQHPVYLPPQKNYFSNLIHFCKLLLVQVEIVSLQEGRASFKMKVDESHLNGVGTLHGGMTAFLVDYLTTITIFTKPPHLPGVSIDMSIR